MRRRLREQDEGRPPFIVRRNRLYNYFFQLSYVTSEKRKQSKNFFELIALIHGRIIAKSNSANILSNFIFITPVINIDAAFSQVLVDGGV